MEPRPFSSRFCELVGIHGEHRQWAQSRSKLWDQWRWNPVESTLFTSCYNWQTFPALFNCVKLDAVKCPKLIGYTTVHLIANQLFTLLGSLHVWCRDMYINCAAYCWVSTYIFTTLTFHAPIQAEHLTRFPNALAGPGHGIPWPRCGRHGKPLVKSPGVVKIASSQGRLKEWQVTG